MSKPIYPPKQSKYLSWYDSIITKAKSQARRKLKRQDENYMYYENHHIIPDSFFINSSRKKKHGFLDGKPNDKENLVLLTAKEHFVAHHLLAKIYGGWMWSAFGAMAHLNKNREVIVRVTASQFQDLKIHMSENLSRLNIERNWVGSRNPNYGNHLSEESKARIGDATRLRQQGKNNPMYGVKQSKETRLLMSKNRQKYVYHTPFGEFVSIQKSI